MLYFALIIIILTVSLWGILGKQKKQANIAGWVEAADLNGEGKQVYWDEKTDISCKPDVVERNKVIEYKSSSIEGKVRWVDLLQLALQLTATVKKEGELRYANKSFVFQKDNLEIRAATRNALKIASRMCQHILAGIPPKATPKAMTLAL